MIIPDAHHPPQVTRVNHFEEDFEMNNLSELTGQESGLVIFENKCNHLQLVVLRRWHSPDVFRFSDSMARDV